MSVHKNTHIVPTHITYLLLAYSLYHLLTHRLWFCQLVVFRKIDGCLLLTLNLDSDIHITCKHKHYVRTSTEVHTTLTNQKDLHQRTEDFFKWNYPLPSVGSFFLLRFKLFYFLISRPPIQIEFKKKKHKRKQFIIFKMKIFKNKKLYI